ncbi:Leucine rich repeat variant [Demequina mangrovi]|uniref:Leucine rich repeat variant n=1 Tax=Demequina mangrovi TaxID=1043493 RepID=A0A1H6WHJ0_9MICO|nr:Leucine rich repeat variant [Demequina mangrovi]
MVVPVSGSSEDVMRALDPGVSGSELLPLAVHRDAAVRAAVAGRSDCPMGALVSLGHDVNLDVLGALLANPRTPSSVVRRLADHRDPRISGLAVQRLRNSFR